jgi:hypothetical protein
MWADAEACFAAQRAHLQARGVALRARLEPRAGMLCAYTPGVVGLALPTLDTPEGTLRATVIGALMGLSPEAVAGLFRTMLPRLVAHEIGHALRAEAGLLGDDRRAEEQVAERLGTLLSSTMISARERAGAALTLRGVTERLGGVREAAAMHRERDVVLAALGLAPMDPAAEAAARERLQRDYSRDLAGYLRLTVAWAWIDLSLTLEDDLDAFRHAHLAA